jgi:hypothetical protein
LQKETLQRFESMFATAEVTGTGDITIKAPLSRLGTGQSSDMQSTGIRSARTSAGPPGSSLADGVFLKFPPGMGAGNGPSNLSEDLHSQDEA